VGTTLTDAMAYARFGGSRFSIILLIGHTSRHQLPGSLWPEVKPQCIQGLALRKPLPDSAVPGAAFDLWENPQKASVAAVVLAAAFDPARCLFQAPRRRPDRQ